MLRKLDPKFSHAQIKEASRRRDISTDQPDAPPPKLRSGPAWASGLRAWGGVRHGPGKRIRRILGGVRSLPVRRRS
jgi:hypothetical protein